ncbi:MAG: glycosyltransferase family 39 protein [Terracidiphilus sp.]|nr:glycosyltransferase family 39 protein [Terracidiphilus sp.]
MEAARLSQSNRSSVRAAASVALAVAAGLTLRVWMLAHFFEVSGDSLIYGGIAKNLLLHGQYALTLPSGQTFSTLIRLPGYPLFLAACFQLFGIDNYAPAVWIQIMFELAGCLLVADCARRVVQGRWSGAAFHAALWLAALCPFTAIYAVSPMTETLTLFGLSAALWSAVRFREQPRWAFALAFTAAVTATALLRPDGVLAFALAPALLFGARGADWRARLRMALVCALLAAAPFVAWTWRNWHVYGVFQPLAPKSATDPGDPTTPGWDRWIKTWCLDFVSTYNVAWVVPGDTLDLNLLPARAFDSPAQRAETEALAEVYNNNGFSLTPELDADFARLAEERIHAHPLRYYVELPVGRVADMWLRPRVENLPIDLDWWVYQHHNAETRFSWFYLVLNLVYLGLGLVGLCLRPRLWPWLLGYMVLRSMMLLTITPPEARYTLECFPMLIVLGGAAIAQLAARVESLTTDHSS